MTSENVPNYNRQHIRIDELLALHKVALQAREAVQVAADAGVHLGPLRAALDETAYRVSPFTPAGVAVQED